MPLRRGGASRGRGRGARGGRGRGRGGATGGPGGATRGRGGRGGGRGYHRGGKRGRGGASGGAKPMEVDQEQSFLHNIEGGDTPVGKLRSIFTGKCEFNDHYDAQIKDLEEYLGVLAVLENSGVEVWLWRHMLSYIIDIYTYMPT